MKLHCVPTIGVCLYLASCCLAVFRDDPTVLVSLLVRNKAHTLPFFLKLFEELDYPKDRISLWIKSDQNQDKSLDILNKWIGSVEKSYKHIYLEVNTSSNAAVENGSIDTKWTDERFRHIIELKEEALNKGREIWADYVWFLDCDVFLNNNMTLKTLVKTNYPVVAPMLDSLSMYSNFWCGMGVDYYYRRTDEYKPIRNREKKGCHRVILVHSCFLVDLRQVEAEVLAFKPENIKGYSGPTDDLITFAISAHWNDVPSYVCNHERFGFIMSPLEDGQTIQDDYIQLTNAKLEASVDFPPMQPHPLLSDYETLPAKDKMGFDEIFLINLQRRPERRERMEWSLDQLGISHKLMDAVDGQTLNDSYVYSLGIRMLPNYADPYHKRAMTMGEIGCFLSHYTIWQEIVDRQLERSIIFEDDIRFEHHFRQKLSNLMEEVDRLKIDWDLIYLGRKRLRLENETWVEGSQQLVNVEYSYWTLSYILSKRGAEKLLDAKPLGQLVPVDEYLPIMFDRHPESRWKDPFPIRNLKAFSASPLLVYPTHYTGETGYISDTESSEIVADIIKKGAKEVGKDEKHGERSSDKLPAETASEAQAAVVASTTPESVAAEIKEITKEGLHMEL